VAAGARVGLTAEEWRWVIVAIGLILVAEAFNSAVERLGDAITSESHPHLRFAKDIAAGAVLVAVITGVVITGTIFAPRLGW
jgi:diacylglycerol kinase